MNRILLESEAPSPGQAPAAARVGIGGPVGSGKTALVERLIPALGAEGIDLAEIGRAHV